MKTFTLSCAWTFITISVAAQVAGPLSGSTFANTPIAGSNKSWVNVGNVGASDDVYATFGNLTGGTGSYTDYLTVTNFGFAVPPTATINGIVVEAERSDPNFRTSDYSIRIIKNNVIGITDRSGGATYPSSDSYQTYGNPADLWGDTWTAADINGSGFGVAIAAQRNSAGGTTAGKVDHVRITVFYNFIVLPLKLLDFSLQKIGNTARLSWVTAEETNMDHFEIERSQNARDFASIGSVPDKNMLSQTNYSFDDDHPLRNISYYRLKMVANTGAVKYSRIIPVQFNSANGISLYPTLWHTGMSLNLINSNNERLTIQFFTESGQWVGTTSTTSNLVFTNRTSNFHGWTVYRVYDEKHQLRGTGKILAE
ncbi:MAG TPA: hypothetical protein VFP87_10335 [Chitinophagaceae bacterium]|nr:hypothetical protein [Chitinophagaceae bacterium]